MPKLVIHSTNTIDVLAWLETERWPFVGLRRDDTILFCDPYFHARLASGIVAPMAIAVRTIPFIVFIPILSRVMGYNVKMEIVVVTLLSFFPSFVLVSSGLSGLPLAASDLSRVFGATRWRKLMLIALPAALPKLFTSIRLSASRAVLGAMVAEFLTGLDGLGRLFLLARGDLEAERALAAAVVAAVAALLLFHVAEWAERYVNRRMA